MPYTRTVAENTIISDDKSLLDVDFIHSYLVRAYWCAGIPRATLERAIEGSLSFGIYQDSKQAGFARVVTDSATFGYLADFFVHEDFQGKGLGTLLVGAIMEHPALQGLRRFSLATRDAHGLYRKFGFTPVRAPERWMEKSDPDIYRNSVRRPPA
jgi:GNAT superfamily N-acetyltransferase